MKYWHLFASLRLCVFAFTGMSFAIAFAYSSLAAQDEAPAMLRQRAQEEGLRNITPVLSTATDPKLPKGKIDLILLVDVYHEFSHPEEMLAAMREALAPEGVCALVEFRAEDPNVPIKPEHKMTKEQIMKEWPPNGFKLVKEFDGLPWQLLMFFGRDEKADK